MAASEESADWVAWHADYDDPTSGLAWRLGIVQAAVCHVLDELPPGPVSVISMCAGQGRDLIGAVTGHPRRADVSARLVELDERNASRARQAAEAAELVGFEVVTGDASVTSSYRGAAPAQLVLACGIFGNISEKDVARTVAELPRLTASGGTVIWTRHRKPPDLTVQIREWLAGAGFSEVSFDTRSNGVQSVGMHRLTGPALPYRGDTRMFRFLR